MKVRSMVGIIPLFAMESIEPAVIEMLPGFRKRMQWFLDNRPDLCGNLASMTRARRGRTADAFAGGAGIVFAGSWKRS